MFDKAQKREQSGFTLIEIMITLAILGILATTTSANFSRFKAKARRSELTMGFGSIRRAQDAYHVGYGRYAADFDQLGFAVQGGSRQSANAIRGVRYSYTMTQPWGDESYYCVASGDIDDDAFLDIAVLEAGRP
ncbi:MAG: type II secretion system protein [Myxococcales bacterium]|nr:MAG: type II secretion system protein [Myxococcales bacterium]